MINRPLVGALLAGGLFVSSADLLADGGALFQAECSACHSLEVTATPAVGPSLQGIINQPAAQQEGYAYSDAMRQKAANGLVWDAATLDRYLLSPSGEVPGTRMGYPGLASAQDRKTLIAWLDQPEPVIKTSDNAISPEIQRILAIDADPAYGEYLASECVTCHGGSNSAGGVPPIAGLPKPYFLQSLLEYKDGTRDNSVMRMMSNNLGDEELAALAAFFNGL